MAAVFPLFGKATAGDDGSVEMPLRKRVAALLRELDGEPTQGSTPDYEDTPDYEGMQDVELPHPWLRGRDGQLYLDVDTADPVEDGGLTKSQSEAADFWMPNGKYIGNELTKEQQEAADFWMPNGKYIGDELTKEQQEAVDFFMPDGKYIGDGYTKELSLSVGTGPGWTVSQRFGNLLSC